jgi:probable HAF family extracellular repeat protein
MNIRSVSRFTFAIALAVASTVQAAPQPRWTILAIPPIAPEGGTTALDINNRGQVVGYGTVYAAQGFALHGFLWDNGTMVDLGVPPGIVSPHSFAYSINDRGTVVASDGPGNAYTWSDGVWSAQNLPGFARHINKFGTLAGSYRPGRFLIHGFIFRDGVFTDIGTLGGETSDIYGINDKGTVVGNSLLANNFETHPFVYDDGVMKDLGTFGGRFGRAQAINNRGEVVGAAWDASNIAHAFIYDGAAIRKLFPARTGNSNAVAVNDRGAVIGWLDGITTSFLLDNGVLTMLEEIPEVRAGGWSWLVPTGINDRGWITGYANKLGSPGGVAFVLIPK